MSGRLSLLAIMIQRIMVPIALNSINRASGCVPNMRLAIKNNPISVMTAMPHNQLVICVEIPIDCQ